MGGGSTCSRGVACCSVMGRADGVRGQVLVLIRAVRGCDTAARGLACRWVTMRREWVGGHMCLPARCVTDVVGAGRGVGVQQRWNAMRRMCYHKVVLLLATCLLPAHGDHFTTNNHHPAPSPFTCNDPAARLLLHAGCAHRGGQGAGGTGRQRGAHPRNRAGKRPASARCYLLISFPHNKPGA